MGGYEQALGYFLSYPFPPYSTSSQSTERNQNCASSAIYGTHRQNSSFQTQEWPAGIDNCARGVKNQIKPVNTTKSALVL